MQMRQSPLARTPPANLPVIPGVTVPASTSPNKNGSASSPTKSNDNDKNASPRKSSMDCPTKLQTVTGKPIFQSSMPLLLLDYYACITINYIFAFLIFYVLHFRINWRG